MSKSEFIYTTYIKTTPEKVWQAITTPEFTRQYWSNENISDWKQGSEWKHVDPQSNKARIEVLDMPSAVVYFFTYLGTVSTFTREKINYFQR